RFLKILNFFENFEFFKNFQLVACIVPQNHCGGLYGPTKSLWWPAWTHKITVVACMVPQNHCGGLWYLLQVFVC
ncbi:MAG: hypothetical protein AAGM46_27825, partial [Cyanobacteria bacterium J06582_2]